MYSPHYVCYPNRRPIEQVMPIHPYYPPPNVNHMQQQFSPHWINPPVNGSIPIDHHSMDGAIPVEPSMNGSIPVEPSMNGSIPVAPSMNGSIPAVPSMNGSIPVAPSMNGSIPAVPSMNGSIPVAPSMNGSIPADHPMNGSIPVNPHGRPGVNPYKVQSGFQGQQGNQHASWLDVFKTEKGQVDVNKVMSTAGQMMSTAQQFGSIVKGIGSFLPKA